MDVERIVNEFGGTGAMAALCEVDPSAVSQWKSKNHIPHAHIKFLRMKRPDLFKSETPRRVPGAGRAAP